MKLPMYLSGRLSFDERWRDKAFTLAELLVVLLVLSMLVCVMLPGLAGTSNAKSRAFTCMKNQRSIMAAMLMYAQDNGDLLPPNPDDGNTVPGHNWCPGQAGVGGIDEYNTEILQATNRNPLANYIGTDVTVYRCTVDPRKAGPYQGADPDKKGTLVPPARSISMNQAVGTVCPTFGASGSGHSGKPVLSVNGPWLDNNHNHHRNSPYRTFGKTSEMIAPTPSHLWVFLEEHPNSINDGGFGFGMRVAEWIDFPTSLHEFGCVFAFADGHTELRKWEDSRTRLPASPIRLVVPGSKDWQWMAERTSAKAQ